MPYTRWAARVGPGLEPGARRGRRASRHDVDRSAARWQGQARPGRRDPPTRRRQLVTGTDARVMGATGAERRPAGGGSGIVTFRVVVADGPPLLLIVTYAIFPSGRRPSGRNLTRVREVAQDRVDGC